MEVEGDHWRLLSPCDMAATNEQHAEMHQHQQHHSSSTSDQARARHTQASDDCPLVFELELDNDNVMCPEDPPYIAHLDGSLGPKYTRSAACSNQTAANSKAQCLADADFGTNDHVHKQVSAVSVTQFELLATAQRQLSEITTPQAPCPAQETPAASGSLVDIQAASSNCKLTSESCIQTAAADTLKQTCMYTHPQPTTTMLSAPIDQNSPLQAKEASSTAVSSDDICCSMVFADWDAPLCAATLQPASHSSVHAAVLQPETACASQEPHLNTANMARTDCVGNTAPQGNGSWPRDDSEETAVLIDNSSSCSQVAPQPEDVSCQMTADTAHSPSHVCSMVFCDAESPKRSSSAACHMCWDSGEEEQADAAEPVAAKHASGDSQFQKLLEPSLQVSL